MNYNTQSSNTSNCSLGLYLYNLREEKGLSIEQVATFMNVSKRTIRYWEDISMNAPRKPGLDDLFKLSMLYDVAIDSMLIYVH